jgi:cytochrome c oxidase subunit 2
MSLAYAGAMPSRSLVMTMAVCGAGCDGPLSALAPAGTDAAEAAGLYYGMTLVFLLIWAAVVALALLLPRLGVLASRRAGTMLIVGGGVVLPLIVLSVLLGFSLTSLQRMLRPGNDAMSIEIIGSQWWWRVRYHAPPARPIESANEIRLPVGRRIEARVATSDVIHSFWIPSIAGKMDMVPGRVNRVQLEPTEVGTYRGACAEFCGASHARMNLVVIVMEGAAFDEWLQAERGPYDAAAAPAAVQRGQAEFFTRGCQTCHTVRGTFARGTVGPDLTHVAARRTIAAGLLPMAPGSLETWIRNTARIKPDARMPAFDALPDDSIADLVAFLGHLR